MRTNGYQWPLCSTMQRRLYFATGEENIVGGRRRMTLLSDDPGDLRMVVGRRIT